MTVRKVAIVTPAGKVVPHPDLCVCGNKTRATRGCECGDADASAEHGCLCDTPEHDTPKHDPSSFHFFETLMDEVDTHASSKQFYNYLIEAGLLHRQKQADYGKTDDPFANVRASEEWGIPGWVGAMVRAQDKVRRLQTHASRGSLVNESVKDSLLDLAVYALISLVLYEQDQAASVETS